ncbi:hypothetical protein E1176_08730 [Fulvivirga sp. RKSG066]|uniref:energy transducer TonB n=1 Tax=Fulvivirga aurantia TaxID=2529383 RepID=UPI0012BD2033|nr:energy transducer TonB [Fulvivirga aurantia]MTI21102.1 hypothetical protein [Fulvivirga aurantia]
MDDSQEFHLEFRCPVNRQSLTKIEGQYHCDECNKRIVDFSKSTQNEIRKSISSSKGLCGIFKSSQLSKLFVKYATATFIITVSLTDQSLAQVKIDTTSQTMSNSIEKNHSDELFGIIVESQAYPIGGYAAFFKTFASKFKLPSNLDAPPDRIYIKFTVDTLGKMNEIETVKSSSRLVAKEVVNTLKKMDFRFEPAQQRGKIVKSTMIIPIIIDVK